MAALSDAVAIEAELAQLSLQAASLMFACASETSPIAACDCGLKHFCQHYLIVDTQVSCVDLGMGMSCSN